MDQHSGESTVRDYFFVNRKIFEEGEEVRVWGEEYAIISDHRIISLDLKWEGEEEMGKGIERDSRSGKGGWKRRDKGNTSFWKKVHEVRRSWVIGDKKGGEGLGKNSPEVIWQGWLQAHNEVAEKGVGRARKRKKERAR